MQWDQPAPPKKQAVVGDLFAFAITSGDFDVMEIFEIVGVGGKNERRRHWDEDIPAQKNKGVVYLSEYIGWVSSRSYVSTMREEGEKVPAVVSNNKNVGKLQVKNGTQVYPWCSKVVVNVP